MAPAPRTGTEWLRAQRGQVREGPELVVSAPVAATVTVEAWLQRHGVSYAPPTQIPMHLIDEKRSRANQARRDPIVADSVDRYTAALRDGAIFPPIVVVNSGGRLTIIDGNNRQAAYRRVGVPTIPGILVAEDTPSELIQLLTIEANAHHGVTPDLYWRIRQAEQLVGLGYPDGKAAEAAAISVAQLRTARAVKEADQRARAMHIVGFDGMAQQIRQRLAGLRDDAVFYQAAKTAVDTAMTCDEVRDMLRQIKACTSEGARVEAIGQIAKDRGLERAVKRATGKQNNRVSSPKQSLVAGIGKVLAVDEATLARSVLTSHDRDQINLRLRQLKRKLTQLELAMETVAEFDEEV